MDASERIFISLIYDDVALNIYAANYFTRICSIFWRPDGFWNLLATVTFSQEQSIVLLSFFKPNDKSGFFNSNGNLSKLWLLFHSIFYKVEVLSRLSI